MTTLSVILSVAFGLLLMVVFEYQITISNIESWDIIYTVGYSLDLIISIIISYMSIIETRKIIDIMIAHWNPIFWLILFLFDIVLSFTLLFFTIYVESRAFIVTNELIRLPQALQLGPHIRSEDPMHYAVEAFRILTLSPHYIRNDILEFPLYLSTFFTYSFLFLFIMMGVIIRSFGILTGVGKYVAVLIDKEHPFIAFWAYSTAIIFVLTFVYCVGIYMAL